MLQVIADAIIKGSLEQISQEANSQGRMGVIETFALQGILRRNGMIPEIDAKRVVTLLDQDGRI